MNLQDMSSETLQDLLVLVGKELKFLNDLEQAILKEEWNRHVAQAESEAA